MKSSVNTGYIFLFALPLLLISSCADNEPVKEDVPELITKVELIFSTPGSMFTVEAIDPDGEGVQNLTPSGPINFKPNTTYMMEIKLYNTLANPGDEGYDISQEVEEEGDEHIFFFSWTKNAFSTPSGDGNIDNRADQVIYAGAGNSVDSNGLPLGLTTMWTTVSDVSDADFRIKLMHQPGLKSATSDASTGETDLDVKFKVNIQD